MTDSLQRTRQPPSPLEGSSSSCRVDAFVLPYYSYSGFDALCEAGVHLT